MQGVAGRPVPPGLNTQLPPSTHADGALFPSCSQGVSVVARLSRNLEELALVERRLDELPYPNLRLVQVGCVCGAGGAAWVGRQAECVVPAVLHGLAGSGPVCGADVCTEAGHLASCS